MLFAQVLRAVLAQNMLQPIQPNIPDMPGVKGQAQLSVQTRTILSHTAMTDAKNRGRTGISSGVKATMQSTQNKGKAAAVPQKQIILVSQSQPIQVARLQQLPLHKV